MAVTDYKFAGTAANADRTSCNDSTGWVNPNNAKADDTNYANDGPAKNAFGRWLRLTNYGFSSSDIPDGATINGIEFVVGTSLE